jgi:hypothetical protein
MFSSFWRLGSKSKATGRLGVHSRFSWYDEQRSTLDAKVTHSNPGCSTQVTMIVEQSMDHCKLTKISFKMFRTNYNVTFRETAVI